VDSWNNRQARSGTLVGLLRCCILVGGAALALAAPLAFADASSSADTLTIVPPSAIETNSEIPLVLIGTTNDAGTVLIYVFAVPGDVSCDATFLQARIDYASDTGAVADVSGPGSYSVTAYLALASAGTYTLCGYVNGLAPDAASASASVTALATLPCDGYAFSLDTPPELVGGRRALAVVTGGPVAHDATFTATATTTDSAGVTGASVPLALNRHSHTNEVAQAGVPVPASGGSATVTVQWQLDSGTTCRGILTSTPITILSNGVPPGVQMVTSPPREGMAILKFTGDCETIAPTPATVSLSGAGIVRRYYIADVCGHWTSVHGPPPTDLSFSTRQASITGPAKVEISVYGDGTASRNTYTLSVKCAGSTHAYTVVAWNGAHHLGENGWPSSLTVTRDG